MKQVDVAYYRERALQERERAERAADAQAAEAHENLASMYERLVAAQPDGPASDLT
jgi:hypothetical protein